ncbi:DnaD domain-containing protein [Pseudobacillus badius]|uniref:DnaD domain-containing protein n=1 Tax=Bacillus badius TaxID=1455 RepID=UPI0007B31E27|nr:DnaD domain protein [Bacillus badius]KZR58336.1 hypothetical protein A3781_17200 [Bacillus badius]
MSRLLLDDKPLIVLPSLAVKVGLNESIVLQQLHYWLLESKNIKDDYKWVYNTYEDWRIQFPFWSVSTIRRIITKLEKQELIIVGNYNKLKIDNTKWYRLNYDYLEYMSRPSAQSEQTECSKWTDTPTQNEQIACSEWIDGEPNLDRPLPEITTEIKKEVEEETPVHDLVNNPFHFYEQNGFGTIGSHIAEKIAAWCEDLSDELVLYAMTIAVEHGKCTWRYVEAILTDWSQKKLTSVDQVKAAQLAYKQQQSQKRQSNRNRAYGRPIREEVLPRWFVEEKEQSTSSMPPREAEETAKTAEDRNAEIEFEEKRKALEERLKNRRLNQQHNKGE